MSLAPEKERAANYETLAALTGDRTRSYRLLMAMPDPERPLYDAAPVLSETLGVPGERIRMLRRGVGEAFAAERLPVKVLFPESRRFPKECGDFFPVIYAAGDLSLLDGQRITLTGMLKPSFQGRSDAAAAVSYFMEHDAAVLTTLDDGIPSLAVSMLLKGGGKPIAVLSGPLSKCSSAHDAEIQGRIFASGLLLSVFPPSQKIERWLVMIRNSFIASISGSVLLAEEKDGGPSWSVFDKVLAAGGRAMLSASMLSVPSYTWARQRTESGALTYSSGRDLRRLLPKAALADDVPDLFS